MMRMSMTMCKQAQTIQPMLQIPTGGLSLSMLQCRSEKQKVVVVMGATGTGKSKLSIDLSTRYPAEIINCDKMQVYEGLDIVTNKITEEECDGVPHHLLGMIDPNADFTAANFCSMASLAMKSITGRGQLPIIVGGSNSFIEALIDDENYEFRSRYECCFLWVDVSLPVLYKFVSERVDRMVEMGLVDEVRSMFDPNADYSKGIRRAIGVPEFDQYFRAEYSSTDTKTRAKLLEAAINETKINTCKLAHRQLGKIHRLKNVKGWKVHRLDATDVFTSHRREAKKVWEEQVAGPSAMIVNQFLFNFNPRTYTDVVTRPTREFGRGQALAAATHW